MGMPLPSLPLPFHPCSIKKKLATRWSNRVNGVFPFLVFLIRFQLTAVRILLILGQNNDSSSNWSSKRKKSSTVADEMITCVM